MDDILAEEVTHPERVKNGDLTEVDIDTILSESSTTKDDIAKSFSTMMQTSNVTGNTTGNATAVRRQLQSSEDSAAPSPHQVASLALVFGIVAATNSMFA